MGTTYTKAPEGAAQVVEEVMAGTYPELAEVRVTVEVLFAWNEKGPPLKLHNWPANAIIRINSLKNRAKGLADAELLIDGKGWEEWNQQKRTALIDHELQHLELVRDKDGNVKTDDAFRPRLKLRPHDWECAGFDAIVERHGIEAFEAESFKGLHKHLSQMKFPWG